MSILTIKNNNQIKVKKTLKSIIIMIILHKNSLIVSRTTCLHDIITTMYLIHKINETWVKMYVWKLLHPKEEGKQHNI